MKTHLLWSALWTTACFSDLPPGESPSTESSSTSNDDTSSSGVTRATTTTGTVEPGSTSTNDVTGPPEPESSSSGVDATSSSSDGRTITGDPVGDRRVFLTNTGFSPNLAGVPGADARCQAEAEAAELSGEFLAWISDEATSPDERFNQDGGPFVLPGGQLIATDWDDLTDGGLEHPIDHNAEGLLVESPLGVWTNTLWDGTALGADCAGWTSNAFEELGFFGDVSISEFGQWSAFGGPTAFPCENTFNLYCFEQ